MNSKKGMFCFCLCLSLSLLQVAVGSVVVHMQAPPTLSQLYDGVLSLRTFSFRGQALLSDLDVHWDAAIVEYGWLMEIVIGQLVGGLHPMQVLNLNSAFSTLKQAVVYILIFEIYTNCPLFSK